MEQGDSPMSTKLITLENWVNGVLPDHLFDRLTELVTIDLQVLHDTQLQVSRLTLELAVKSSNKVQLQTWDANSG